jgi:hypothetical protein
MLGLVVAALFASGWSTLFYAISRRAIGPKAALVFAICWFFIILAPNYIITAHVL